MASIASFAGSGHPLLERLEVAFDPVSRTLARGGRHRHLAPREAGVLAALLRAEAGQVIGRAELLDAVWGDGDVCEDALTVIVSRLRRHFDRLGVGDPVIETVPRQGYRLGACRDEVRGWREARRHGWLGIGLGFSALLLSSCALVIASLALALALR